MNRVTTRFDAPNTKCYVYEPEICWLVLRRHVTVAVMNSNGSSEASGGYRTLFLDVMNDASRWEGRTQGPGIGPQPGRGPINEENELISGVRSSSGSKSGELRGHGDMGGCNFVDGGPFIGRLPRPGEYKYEIEVIGAVESINNRRVFGIPWTYVSYVIKVKRLPDGVSSVVSKRYSAIRGLVNDLQAQGLVDKSSVQSFPKKDIGLNNKVGRALVVRRQRELQDFFQLLFMNCPTLWESKTVKTFMDLDLMTSGEHFLEAELRRQLSEREAAEAITQAVRGAEEDKRRQHKHGETTKGHISTLGAVGKLLTSHWDMQQQSLSGDGTHQQTHPDRTSNTTTPPNELISQICSMGFREDQARNALAAAGNDLSLAVQIILDNEGVLPPERSGLLSTVSSANQQSLHPQNHMAESPPDLLSSPAIIPTPLHPSLIESQCSTASHVITRAPGNENVPYEPHFTPPQQPRSVHITRLYKNETLEEEPGSAGPGTVDV